MMVLAQTGISVFFHKFKGANNCVVLVGVARTTLCHTPGSGVSRKMVRGVLHALAHVENLTTPLITSVKLHIPTFVVINQERILRLKFVS